MKTPGPSLFRSIHRFSWHVLLLAMCSLQPSHAQTTPATVKDFMDARDTAEKERDAVLSILRQHANSRSIAEDAANTIKRLSLSRDTDASALKVLSDEDTVLQGLIDGKVLDALAPIADSTKDPLAVAKGNLTTAKQKLDGLKNNGNDFSQVLGTEQQNLVSQTSIDCQTALDQANKDDSLNKDSSKKLTDALPSIVTQATEVTKKLNDALNPLTTLGALDPKTAEDTKKSQVLKVTGRSLPIFADIVSLKGPCKDKWRQVSTKLNILNLPGAPAPKDLVGDNFTTLDNTITAIVANLPNWLTVVQQAPSLETEKLQTLSNSVDKDAAANTAAATVELRTAINLRDSSKSIVDTWNKLTPIADQLGAGGTTLTSDTVSTSLAAFAKDSQTLFGAISRLQEAIAGDFSEFEADQQQLFYFTDVPRLMQMLNPGAYEIGGIKGAQEQAAAQHQKLAQAELELAAAQAEVNSYQTRLMQLPEELKQARAEARKQDSLYGKTSNRLNSLTDQLSAATGQVNTLKSTPTTPSATANQTNQNTLAQAQKEQARLTAQNTDAQRDNGNALHDKDVADQKLKAAEDEQTGIPAQIEKAKLALSAAQNNVSQRRQESLLAAQAESDAFAVARDNTPYWFAPAVGISKDPARRVEMYGTNDSKIIYLRGKRADLEAVKNIIAGIDTPAPQARITLWSLQLNYTSDTKGNGAKQMNDALFGVEDILAEIRSRMAVSVSLLRDSVNAQVNAAVKSLCTTDMTANDCRVLRIRSFYNPEILRQLGDDPIATASFAEVSRLTVPDPSGTTTLGEALLILSLAKPEVRRAVLDEFQIRINTARANWTIWHSSEKFGKTDTKFIVPPEFTRLRRALDADGLSAIEPARAATRELTSSQLEISRAILSAATAGFRQRIASLTAQLQLRNANLRKICGQISAIDKAVPPEHPSVPKPCESISGQASLGAATGNSAELKARRNDLMDEAYAEWAAAKSLGDELAPLLWFYWQHFGAAPESFRSLSSSRDIASAIQNAVGNPQAGAELYSPTNPSSLLASHPLREATPREAAADEMLKELMTAMEEDLDRIFIRPGLAYLREDIARQRDLQVGVIQRTSTLATNRLQARVDPRASAQLALGEEQDILQSVTQLGQIYLAAQSGGAFGTLSALNDLKQQTKQPPQEIYGITTGSTFKITPIFDPSGQALRFKFDFVSANNVTEPNGTTNPQLPRIERHTVNTEVQITNLELREISRYEANSKLGLATKYWGGLPIFRDIIEEFPRARPYIPIFGWFVRKSGSAAVSQESVLFGQTTIYPTIGDIMRLLIGDSGSQ